MGAVDKAIPEVREIGLKSAPTLHSEVELRRPYINSETYHSKLRQT